MTWRIANTRLEQAAIRYANLPANALLVGFGASEHDRNAIPAEG